MEKSLFEQMGGTYRQEGDYLVPNLLLPNNTDMRDIGVYGRRHLNFIKKHKKVLYTELLTSGKLHCYLADLNEEVIGMHERLMKQMAEKQGITEHLKATDQMAWVGAMNSIRNRAEEIIRNEFIYL